MKETHLYLEDNDSSLDSYIKTMGVDVYKTQSELGGRVKAHPLMLPWCKMQGDVLVLESGLILAVDPCSRSVQNCRIIMLNKGIKPVEVRPATLNLIKSLSDEMILKPVKVSVLEESATDQQQRLRQLVFEAMRANSSDIHLEVRETTTHIRFRRHGELYYHAEWTAQLGRQLASVAFNKETDHAISHFNPLRPQNASMTLDIDNKQVRLRLATIPAGNGFDLVMRVLAVGQTEIPDLCSLGYTSDQIKLISDAVAMPYGAILIAGPTGSGKTTTVASCLNLIPHTRKIYTIEEPVEKMLDHVTQISVNTDHNAHAFSEMGRAALRMDPDVLVLGEMRDEKTAAVMLRASLTGHLVFSTLHTNRVFSIVTRLVDLGLSRHLLADQQVLDCLICQRLVPLLCSACKLPFESSHEYQSSRAKWDACFQEKISSIYRRGQHCQVCQGTGLAGRTVIAEVIRLDNQSREFILSGSHLAWEHYLLESKSWKSYHERGLELIKSGCCDPIDVESVIGHYA